MALVIWIVIVVIVIALWAGPLAYQRRRARRGTRGAASSLATALRTDIQSSQSSSHSDTGSFKNADGHPIRHRGPVIAFASVVLTAAVVATVGLVRLATDQTHLVQVLGAVTSGHCFYQSGGDGSGGETQCDVEVSYVTPAGMSGVKSFHDVPASAIVTGTGESPRSGFRFSDTSYSQSASMPVYFDGVRSSRPINPNDVNPEWVYWVAVGGVWLGAGLLGVLPLRTALRDSGSQRQRVVSRR